MLKYRITNIVSLLLVALITIGFGNFNMKDSLTSITNFNKSVSIPYENVEITKMSNEDNFSIENTKEGINYNLVLEKPGDYYEFTLDMVNNANYDVKITNLNLGNLTEKQKRYLEYKVTYLNGEIIKPNDIIKANSKITLKVSIYFKEDITAADLPTGEDTFDLGLDMNLEKAD